MMMLDTNQWLTLLVGLSGVLSSVVIAVLAYSLNRQAQRAQTERAVSESYNLLMNFRSDYPEVLKLGRLWTVGCFSAIYRQATQEEKLWVSYYTYAELCLSFVNAVLYGWKSHLLDRDAYEGQYKPLIKLVLTEHDPFIRTMLPEGKYVSSYIKEFRVHLESEGWDWKTMHLALANEVDATKSQ